MTIEAARVNVANAILAACHHEACDLGALKPAARAVLARDYRLDLKP